MLSAAPNQKSWFANSSNSRISILLIRLGKFQTMNVPACKARRDSPPGSVAAYAPAFSLLLEHETTVGGGTVHGCRALLCSAVLAMCEASIKLD